MPNNLSITGGDLEAPHKMVDVYCPVHGNWIGHYKYGSIGVYYVWCKKCKKEIEILMTR